LLPIQPNEATGEAKVLFDAIQQRLPRVPNMLGILGHSPKVLASYLAFTDAFSSLLAERLRILITIAVAQIAGGDYLLSFAHVLGKRDGLNEEQMNVARHGESSDAKTAAVLQLAAKAAREHGRVSEGDLAAVREAGYTDAELVAIVAYIALDVFRPYFNIMAQTAIDFPVVKSADLA
ncbi:MAG: carboxymuconolactone decarboxylase family protein, partial [Acidobacteria bacterium]|nr:carboxymuconolactone decarboxylase family protein [Acidobacteriota bacterium]